MVALHQRDFLQLVLGLTLQFPEIQAWGAFKQSDIKGRRESLCLGEWAQKLKLFRPEG